MIIVEGPDGAGKTTLINKLVKGTGLPVAPRVVSKDAEAMTDLVAWTEENVKKGWQNVIFDRHRLISEPIYGPVLRPEFEPKFDDQGWLHSMYHEFYMGVRPLVIYCLPSFDVVWENVKDDPSNRVVGQRQQLRAIYGAYLNRAMVEQLFNPSTFLYDYTDSSAPMLDSYFVSTIKRLAEENK